MFILFCSTSYAKTRWLMKYKNVLWCIYCLNYMFYKVKLSKKNKQTHLFTLKLHLIQCSLVNPVIITTGSWLTVWLDPDWLFDWIPTGSVTGFWLDPNGEERLDSLHVPAPQASLSKQLEQMAADHTSTDWMTDWLTLWVNHCGRSLNTPLDSSPTSYCHLVINELIDFFFFKTISTEGTLMMDVLTLSGESLGCVSLIDWMTAVFKNISHQWDCVFLSRFSRKHSFCLKLMHRFKTTFSTSLKNIECLIEHYWTNELQEGLFIYLENYDSLTNHCLLTHLNMFIE